MRPNLLVVAVAFVLTCAVLALVLTQKAAGHEYEQIETTSDTVTTTTWPQSVAALPEGFDPQQLAPKPKVKSKQRVVTASRPSSELADMIRAGFARFGPAVAEEAVRVAGCESTGDETGNNLNEAAKNGPHAGLFQLSRIYHEERARRLGFTWDQMFQAGPNIAVAVDLFAEQGSWSPTWTCAWAA